MRILFFAPHAAIWYTSFPEALIADSLARGGHDIIYLTCGRGLDEFWEVAENPQLQLEGPAKQIVDELLQSLLKARAEILSPPHC